MQKLLKQFSILTFFTITFCATICANKSTFAMESSSDKTATQSQYEDICKEYESVLKKAEDLDNTIIFHSQKLTNISIHRIKKEINLLDEFQKNLISDIKESYGSFTASQTSSSNQNNFKQDIENFKQRIMDYKAIRLFET